MAVNDVYKILMKTEVDTQRFLNVFYYQNTTGGTGNAGDLSDLFANFVALKILAILSSATVLKFVEVYNLNDSTDYDINTYSFIGGRSGNYDTRHIAHSFTLVRSRTDIKSGGKRFGAVSDVDVANEGWLSSLDPLLTDVSQWLVNPLVSAPDATTWRPRLRAHRYGMSLPGYYAISSAPFLGITSQNTRKFYTGAGW